MSEGQRLVWSRVGQLDAGSEKNVRNQHPATPAPDPWHQTPSSQKRGVARLLSSPERRNSAFSVFGCPFRVASFPTRSLYSETRLVRLGTLRARNRALQGESGGVGAPNH